MAARQSKRGRKSDVATSVTLQNGTVMPLISLGTWKSPKGAVAVAVKAAIEAGYRAIDCANDYGNEAEIGQALKELFDAGVVKREELFIQAKLWNSNHRKDHVKADLVATLKDLQLAYVDSFVIHWPQACPSSGKAPAVCADGPHAGPAEQGTMFPLDAEGKYCVDVESHYVETWHVMEGLVDEGLCKSIGLSNFNLAQIREILDNVKTHRPQVLQNECHPYLQLKDLADFCRINQIQIQAYCPLGSYDRPFVRPNDPEVSKDPRIAAIATKYKKSWAQVVLRWHTQRGICATPKSVTPERIKENISIWDFELSPEDMAEFDRFNIGYRLLLWPETSGHPDYPFKDDVPYGYVVGPAPTNTTKSSR